MFGWKKLSKKAHAACMWLVAIASNLSGIWILLANGWMQQPVGFDIRNGRAEMSNFFEVLTNSFAWYEYFHVVAGAAVLSAFLVMGISAFHLLRKQYVDFFTRSFKIGLTVGLAASLFVALEGDMHGSHVAQTQPSKLAAMESLWETQTKAPIYLFAVPDEKAEKNIIQLGEIPGLLSLLVHKNVDAEVIGLKDIPKDERPPVFLTFMAFRGMVGLGTYFILITAIGWFLRNKLVENPLFLKIMMFSIPLPYIAIELGWMVAEVGRQPWIVYKLMRTAHAVSPVAASQVGITLAAFILVYGLLGAVGFWLIYKNATKGPEPINMTANA
jgi:cytochrome d ubiquinol oxidase subunit I